MDVEFTMNINFKSASFIILMGMAPISAYAMEEDINDENHSQNQTLGEQTVEELIDHGSAQAQYEFAVKLYNDKNSNHKKEAIALFQRAADQGHENSLKHLLMQCKDGEQAMRITCQAAELNSIWALSALGRIYEGKTGENGADFKDLVIKKDLLTSTNFYNRGALQGDHWCQDVIADIYYYPDSKNVLPFDAAKAAQFLKMSITQNKIIMESTDTYDSDDIDDANQDIEDAIELLNDLYVRE